MNNSSTKFLRVSEEMGVLPIVSTARAAMQQASAAVGIIAWPLARPVAKRANNESPAPATSSGLTDRAEGLAAELARGSKVVGNKALGPQLHHEAFTAGTQ